MTLNQMIIDKEKIAKLVRDCRQAKGYTQQEVAEQTGLSLRSVQRIENGEVLARLYTLKILSKFLSFNIIDASVPKLQTPLVISYEKPQANVPRKVIVSVALAACLLFGSIAFISQSNTFPETSFEAFAFLTAVTLLAALLLYRIWK